MGTRLLEHLDTRHLRHPLVRGDQRHRLVAEGELGQHDQRLGPRRRANDAVVGAILAGQVAGDRRRDQGVGVDRQDGRFAHEISPRATSLPAQRRLEERKNRQSSIMASATTGQKLVLGSEPNVRNRSPDVK
jgi:hypothetical protein